MLRRSQGVGWGWGRGGGKYFSPLHQFSLDTALVMTRLCFSFEIIFIQNYYAIILLLARVYAGNPSSIFHQIVFFYKKKEKQETKLEN
jgi:hypothetical protein